MALEIKVPVLPESVAEGILLDWQKQPGEQVRRDQILVEVETDKVVLEVPSPVDGVLGEIMAQTGAVVTSEQILATVNAGAVAAPKAPAEQANDSAVETAQSADDDPLMGPAVRKLIQEHGLDPTAITATGPGGRLTKADLLEFITNQVSPEPPDATPPPQPQPATPAAKIAVVAKPRIGRRDEVREPMSRLRQTIANRLVQSQQTAAILTTFNEVNMRPLQELRDRYKQQFEKAHDTRLGLMPFFVKASVAALQKFPLVNAYIDGADIVRHHYQDIGIAVASPRGLVVPVLRNCEDMGFADIEAQIMRFGDQAKHGKIGLDDLTGGTFTITNGGVFGSLLSTPIINPPQSAILGMHNIQERPVAANGEVVICPMMYLALSYDHRIIDGKEAVQFLVTIKDMVEDPARTLLQC